MIEKNILLPWLISRIGVGRLKMLIPALLMAGIFFKPTPVHADIGCNVVVQKDTIICPGESIFLGGAWQTETGIYYDTLPVAQGCDTVYITALNAGPPAVLFSEDFSNTPAPAFPAGWALFNVDGNAPDANVGYVTDAWIIREYFSVVGDSLAFSTSWYNPIGTSDDWMFTPAINLTVNNILTWNAFAPDPSFPDGYEVRISTLGQTPADALTNPPLFSIGAEGQAWTSRDVSLSDYNNQTVYIAFRNNSNDRFLLLIDDIVVTEPGYATYFFQKDTTICEGGSIFAGGALQTTSGVYYDTLQTVHGCDSICETTLTVEKRTLSIAPDMACEFESFNVTITGTCTDFYTATGSCGAVNAVRLFDGVNTHNAVTFNANSATELEASFEGASPSGIYDVIVEINCLDDYVCDDCFEIKPSTVSAEPVMACATEPFKVTITGTCTDFYTATASCGAITAIKLINGSEHVPASINVIGPGELEASFDGIYPEDTFDIVVERNCAEDYVCEGCVIIKPSIISADPVMACVEDPFTVTITGTCTDFYTATASCGAISAIKLFNGAEHLPVSINVIGPEQMEASFDGISPADTFDIIVERNCVDDYVCPGCVIIKPATISVEPVEICEGDSFNVTISGTCTDFITGTASCGAVSAVRLFDGTHTHNATSFNANSPSELDASFDGVSPYGHYDLYVDRNCKDSYFCDDCVEIKNCDPCLGKNLEVIEFTLMYEGVLGEIGPLENGMVINKDTLCRFSVRADVCPDTVGSVKFVLTGAQNHTKTENIVPYSLFGDAPPASYYVWIPNTGNYTLTATPYSKAGATGTIGTPLTLSFSVVGSVGNNSTSCSGAPDVDCNGVLNGAAYTNQCGFCVGGNTGLGANAGTDCNGICNGPGVIVDNVCCVNGVIDALGNCCPSGNVDCFGVCNGQAAADCNGVCNGNAFVDSCGVCAGGNTGITPNQCQQNCNLRIVSFTLINADTDNDIGPLTNGYVINLAVTPRISIRANECQQPVGSVKLQWNGGSKTESIAPYSIAGDNNGNYYPWNVGVGSYILTATPYSKAGATGTVGTALTVNFQIINNNAQCTSSAECNDNNACTTDNCSAGICTNVPVNTNDGNACTADNCNPANGVISHLAINCDDGNSCTDDSCSTVAGCVYTPIIGCCNSNADCSDNDPCTIDVCDNGTCLNLPGVNEPSYLHIVNPSMGWRKLQLGYGSSLWNPKQNVTAGGNTHMCITLRDVNGTADWSKLQIRPQGSSSAYVTLGNYIGGPVTNWTTICIPLSDFNSTAFTQLSFIEIPFASNAAAFEIDIQKIIFNGGSSFLWFGDAHTNNTFAGTLSAMLVAGNPCVVPKRSGDEGVAYDQENEGSFLNAYPNPFKDKVTIDFKLPVEERVKLELVGIDGRRIATIFEGTIERNKLNSVEFQSGSLADGMYFYRLITESGEIRNRKLLLVR